VHAFLLFTILWLLGWGVFLLSTFAERDGHRTHSHTLFDSIEAP
jgi:hypothetical protein